MIVEDELIRVDFLLKQISLIQHDLANKTYEDFEKSDLLVRATAFSLVQIGEQMNKLETMFKDRYPELPWADARRMRNIIVHVYVKVDAAQVYETASKDLDVLTIYFSKIKQDLLNEIS